VHKQDLEYAGFCIRIGATIIDTIGITWVGIDRRKQGWHDKLAGTVVVRNIKTEPVEFAGQI
jgi:uncharacterized RDD family membrane protein YckC